MKNIILFTSMLFFGCVYAPVEQPPKTFFYVYKEINNGSEKFYDTLECKQYYQVHIVSDRPYDDYDSVICITQNRSQILNIGDVDTLKMVGANLKPPGDSTYFKLIEHAFPNLNPKKVRLFSENINGNTHPYNVMGIIVYGGL